MQADRPPAWKTRRRVPRRVGELLAVLDAHHGMRRWALPYEDDLERAWRECHRGNWLVLLAARAGVEHSLIATAVADCLRFAIHCGDGCTPRTPDERAAMAAVEAVLAYATTRGVGVARPEEPWLVARLVTRDRFEPMGDVSRSIFDAVTAARLLLRLADGAADDAHEAVIAAAQAAARHRVNTSAVEESLAKLVRTTIPFSAIESALAAWPSRPAAGRRRR